MGKQILILILLFQLSCSFAQEKIVHQKIVDERLGQKNILLSGDSLYQPLYDFIVENSLVPDYNKVQIRYTNIIGCDACSYGIYKFERLSTGQESFLYFKNRDGKICIIDNYKIEDLIVKALNFFKENNYSDEDQCIYIKAIMDFLLEKNEYTPEINLPTNGKK